MAVFVLVAIAGWLLGVGLVAAQDGAITVTSPTRQGERLPAFYYFIILPLGSANPPC